MTGSFSCHTCCLSVTREQCLPDVSLLSSAVPEISGITIQVGCHSPYSMLTGHAPARTHPSPSKNLLLVKWHSKSLQCQKVISPNIHAHPLGTCLSGTWTVNVKSMQELDSSGTILPETLKICVRTQSHPGIWSVRLSIFNYQTQGQQLVWATSSSPDFVNMQFGWLVKWGRAQTRRF